ncbi:hypothetical protein COSO111634_27215 [Corallococcus soli]
MFPPGVAAGPISFRVPCVGLLGGARKVRPGDHVPALPHARPQAHRVSGQPHSGGFRTRAGRGVSARRLAVEGLAGQLGDPGSRPER